MSFPPTSSPTQTPPGDGQQKHDQKYYELDAKVPLRQALAGTHILEYPQVLVVPSSQAQQYARTPFAPVRLVDKEEESQPPPPPQTTTKAAAQTS